MPRGENFKKGAKKKGAKKKVPKKKAKKGPARRAVKAFAVKATGWAVEGVAKVLAFAGDAVANVWQRWW